MLDVGAHYDAIVRIIRSHPVVGAAVRVGLDEDDLVHDIVLSILARQRTGTAYQAERGSISNYVWWVARSVAWNRLSTFRVGVPSDGTVLEDQLVGESPIDVDATVRNLVDALDLDATEHDILIRIIRGESYDHILRVLHLGHGRASRPDRVAVVVGKVRRHLGGE